MKATVLLTILLTAILTTFLTSKAFTQNQATTYKAEIEKRKQRVNRIEQKLDEIRTELRVVQKLLYDFGEVSLKLRDLVSKQEGKKIKNTWFIERNYKWADEQAKSILKDPPSVPSKLIPVLNQQPVNLPIAGGRFVIRNGAELIEVYRQFENLAPDKIQDVSLLSRKIERYEKEKARLIKEINTLSKAREKRERDATSLIGGKWVLDTEKNGTVIFVFYHEASKSWQAVIDTNNLPYFNRLDTLFSVRPVGNSKESFVGTEFAYNDQGEPVRNRLQVDIRLGFEMIYFNGDETLTWYPYHPPPHSLIRGVRGSGESDDDGFDGSGESDDDGFDGFIGF